jgi:hypothetical protein
MSEFGTCERGCTDQRLELVPADRYDRLTALAADARLRAQAFRGVAEELASDQPGPGEWESACRSVQQAARIALRRYPDHTTTDDEDWAEPGEPVTTWWCAGCGGIDAPQPCLGICIWRPVQWVNAARYEHERTRALAERETEQRLRLLLRLVASVTPRDGQWQTGWSAVAARARRTLQHRDERAEDGRPRSSGSDIVTGQ